MPILYIHGIGTHDIAAFRAIFLQMRTRLCESLTTNRPPPPEAAFFPIFWGDWGPHTWYRGAALESNISLERSVPTASAQMKAAAVHQAEGFDAGLDALRIVLSAPGPLQAVLADLGISETELLHAVEQTAGQPHRAEATVMRLLVRERLTSHGRAHGLAEHPESRAALRALLGLILEQPPPMAKGLPAIVAYPFWTTVTALARHLRGALMQTATSFIGDVMLYLARGAEVRQFVHAAVTQACAARPDEPLVLIAHSLGGVIAYQYLIDPAFQNRSPVDLLVTVGSQVALFAEYGLYQAGPTPITPHQGEQLTTSIQRWLNIYDPDDFLAFPIGGIFSQATNSDHPIQTGKPFPASHSAYWENEHVYRVIAEVFPS